MFISPPIALTTELASAPVDLSAVSGGPAGYNPTRLFCYGEDDSTITVDGVVHPMISTDGTNGYLEISGVEMAVITAVSGVTRVIAYWPIKYVNVDANA